MDYILNLTFLCANGEKSSISIDPVSPTIASEQAIALMDVIITKNVFVTKNGSLTGRYVATLTQRQVTKFAVQ
jgi:hypothetical protein